LGGDNFVTEEEKESTAFGNEKFDLSQGPKGERVAGGVIEGGKERKKGKGVHRA